MAAIVIAVGAAALLPPPLHLAAVIIALFATVALVVTLVPAQSPDGGAPTVESAGHMVPVPAQAIAGAANAGTIGAANETTASLAPVAEPDLTGVLAALPVGVMVIGDDGKIRAFNAAAGELFGVSAERARNRALIEIVRNFELDRRVTATLRTGVEETGELPYSAAHERYLQVTTRVLGGVEGRRSALVIIADQTRMRELEKLRRDFVSNVSHELRTPLTAVKLMVETLQSGVEQPASDEFLGSIAQETERMIALVEDLLDLARLESGKLELRLSTVDIGELCQHAAQAQARRAQTLGVALECSAPEAPMKISADRDKVYQVVVNLLDNALRHTPSGGRVDLAVEPGDGTVDIVVSDTGGGIPSSALPHIFERFYVVDPARARGPSGTGLGLSIVKHIIEAHGGTVEAKSELGTGATFRCRLVAAG
ncbi:MAG: PAS domain-containing protein [Candidatus Eremiobacteraeota bacterium]|nr:PAS domain-containing protein [Candidatus Eremiobacteraeota bacterium]MBV8204392.1 PAS domain-containing protein [Candidatus Eremiobacteraeota bacterium]MBV8263411.1 PAS domain-containing protein [Candidatus Eremiobacteraeota bacterium]